ncbi:unnamed protein product, partial [marine sediment metagenome]
EIDKVIRNLDFRIAILSDDTYILEGYEIVRLINIFCNTKRIRKSLKSFEAMIRRRDDIYENQLDISKGKKEIPH